MQLNFNVLNSALLVIILINVVVILVQLIPTVKKVKQISEQLKTDKLNKMISEVGNTLSVLNKNDTFDQLGKLDVSKVNEIMNTVDFENMSSMAQKMNDTICKQNGGYLFKSKGAAKAAGVPNIKIC